jgi:predicted Zn-dependent protease
MRNREREALAQRLIARSTADVTEVVVTNEANALTRFTHNAIHQNLDQRDDAVAIRAIVDGRTGTARSNARDEAALDATLERAIALARFAPRDPDGTSLPGAASYATHDGGAVGGTFDASPEMRAARAADVFAVAEAADLWAAGYVRTASRGTTIANSLGALASYEGTEAAINVKMNAPDATGYGERYDVDVAAIDGGAIARRAAEKAVASRAPRAVDPGAWTVILEPAAFGELLAYLIPHFSAQAFEEGSSFASGALDTTVASATFSMTDDASDPRNVDAPFDWEGAPRMRVPLIEDGVVRNVVTDARYATRLGRTNTGHALPAPNAHGPQAQHVVVANGTQSLDELLAGVERGLLITRFWYIRNVDQRKTIVTGMTRDGTFLIENGALAYGVKNLRFNVSILDVLGRATFANDAVRTGGYSYSLVAPTARLDGFRFTSSTDF